MRLLDLFRPQPVTASQIGHMGAAERKRRERAKIRAKADEMRAAMGMEPARWPK